MSDDRDDRGDRVRQRMMAALDGELSRQQRAELERELASDPGLRAEWERMSKVKEATHSMSYRQPPEETWDHYFESVYNRMERGLGWILVSFGALVLTGYGLWEFVHRLLVDTSVPAAIKIALFALLFGGAILLVSVIRERLFVGRTDPYREIKR